MNRDIKCKFTSNGLRFDVAKCDLKNVSKTKAYSIWSKIRQGV